MFKVIKFQIRRVSHQGLPVLTQRTEIALQQNPDGAAREEMRQRLVASVPPLHSQRLDVVP